MKEIVVKVTDERYHRWVWTLRRRYGRDKRTSLAKLIRHAVLEAVADESRKVYEEACEQL